MDTPVRRFLETYAMSRDLVRKRKAEPYEDAEMIAQKAIRDAQVAAIPVAREQANTEWLWKLEDRNREARKYDPNTPEGKAYSAKLAAEELEATMKQAQIDALLAGPKDREKDSDRQWLALAMEQYEKGLPIEYVARMVPADMRMDFLSTAHQRAVQKQPPVETFGTPTLDFGGFSMTTDRSRPDVGRPDAFKSEQHPGFVAEQEVKRLNAQANVARAGAYGQSVDNQTDMLPYRQREIISRNQARSAYSAYLGQKLVMQGKRTNAEIAHMVAQRDNWADERAQAWKRIGLDIKRLEQSEKELALKAKRMTLDQKEHERALWKDRGVNARASLAASTKAREQSRAALADDPDDPVLKEELVKDNAAVIGDTRALQAIERALNKLGGPVMQEVTPSGAPKPATANPFSDGLSTRQRPDPKTRPVTGGGGGKAASGKGKKATGHWEVRGGKSVWVVE